MFIQQQWRILSPWPFFYISSFLWFIQEAKSLKPNLKSLTFHCRSMLTGKIKDYSPVWNFFSPVQKLSPYKWGELPTEETRQIRIWKPMSPDAQFILLFHWFLPFLFATKLLGHKHCHCLLWNFTNWQTLFSSLISLQVHKCRCSFRVSTAFMGKAFFLT